MTPTTTTKNVTKKKQNEINMMTSVAMPIVQIPLRTFFSCDKFVFCSFVLFFFANYFTKRFVRFSSEVN